MLVLCVCKNASDGVDVESCKLLALGEFELLDKEDENVAASAHQVRASHSRIFGSCRRAADSAVMAVISFSYLHEYLLKLGNIRAWAASCKHL